MPARKRFGQHFLHDPGIIGRIIDHIAPADTDHLVEIGPGRGALTEPLLDRCPRLDVIEIDRDLAPALQQRFGGQSGFTLHEADALRFDYTSLGGDPPLRLVGNLPYNISSPLLFALLASPAPIGDMHFMLQKEVVDRMVAGPGEADYGRLSVAVASRARAERLMTIGPGAFQPPPKVESAIVRVRPRAPDFAIDCQRDFDRVLQAAFSARRKTIRNGLKGLLDRSAIIDAGVDPGQRPEQLTPAEFAALANRFTGETA
ncbi:MAG: 16S rRNA (adenine(1518)-N(6)/adenine(1519)-N(6))-dimethyltransferase RsmA [Salinisphaeraceae bacterium]